MDTKTGKGAAAVIGAGLVNNPENRSLRFDMIEFGLREFCRQLLVAGAPLRLADEQPIIGRFFAESCQAESLDSGRAKSIVVQFGGRGYAWTTGTGRLGFRARGLLELSPDFRIYEGALYVYFRPIKVDTSDFEVLMTERKLTQAVINVAGLNEEELGRAIINAQLGRGFTAVRYDADGYTDFALGLVAEGDTPFKPFRVLSSAKTTSANARTELIAGQQDYLGRIHMSPGKELTLTAALDGTDVIDVLVIPAEGGAAIREYVSQPGARAPKVKPNFSAQLSQAAPLKADLELPPGDYYVVFDHSDQAGVTTPAPPALPARVDYLLQVGPATAR